MNRFPNVRLLRLLAVSALLLILTGAGALFWLSRNLTTVVERALRRTYGPEFSLGGIESGWNRVVLHDVRLKGTGSGPIGDRISIERVTMTPRFSALLSRRIEIGQLRLEKPRLLVEIAPDGTVISPLSPRHRDHPASRPSLPHLAIGRVDIAGGELILMDRSHDRLRMPGISNRREGYHLIRFTDVGSTTGPLEFPAVPAVLPVSLRLTAPGPGTLHITGTVNPVTRDAGLKITLRHWDLTRFRPYYLKPDDLDVTHGFLDADATVTIASRKLHAPGEIRLRGLEVARNGRQGAFMGMSATAFLAVMKGSDGTIDTTFQVNGDLSHPRFKVRQSLMEQIGSGLARKLGLPVISEVGSGIIGLGKKGISGIESLFGGKK